MNYIVIRAKVNPKKGEETISEKVNKYLKNGWKLQGGISTGYEEVNVNYNPSSGGLHTFKPYLNYYQAMIRTQKNKKEF